MNFIQTLITCYVLAEPEVHPLESRYLHLHELFIDDIVWVDEADSLQKATSYIEGCKVVGVDCEWKPNYVKGSKGNKVPCHNQTSFSGVIMFIPLHFSEVYTVNYLEKGFVKG